MKGGRGAGAPALGLPAGRPAGHQQTRARCQPPRDRAQREWPASQGLPEQGGEHACDSCTAAPPPGHLWCPSSSLYTFTAGALRQVRGKTGHSRGLRRETESSGHHPPGPVYSQRNKMKPQASPHSSPLGPAPALSRQHSPGHLFAPMPVLCAGPCSLQAPAARVGHRCLPPAAPSCRRRPLERGEDRGF